MGLSAPSSRLARLLAVGTLAVLVPLLAMAAKPARLPRTRVVIEDVTASFAGPSTRAQLLAGGLDALMRLAPGTSYQADGARLTITARGKAWVVDTSAMISDTEVAGALERAVLKAGPRGCQPDVDDAVASGIVNALGDRHSSYLKAFYVQRLGYTPGELLGDPGIDPTFHGGAMVVRSVAPGSSAATAGLAPGQILRRVDNINVDGLSLGEVSALLLGQSTSPVSVVVQPDAQAGPVTHRLVRDPPYALEPHIRRVGHALHVVPGPLLGNAHIAIRQALADRGDVAGVVLDLRGNGGGKVGDGVAVADLFAGKGPLAQVQGRAGRPAERYDGRDGDPGEGVPLVILVDGRTASASELVALVLRERRGVRLMGCRSYGKGSVQKLLPIEGGALLKITSGHYLSAGGTSVGDGLEPDVPLPLDSLSRRGEEGELARDAWLKAAHDALATPPPSSAPAP
jgi:carboxyl-terminal processing protease